MKRQLFLKVDRYVYIRQSYMDFPKNAANLLLQVIQFNQQKLTLLQ